MAALNDVNINRNFPDVPSGFNFENFRRNQSIEAADNNINKAAPVTKKTGTTICGAIFDGGLVLGADTRATANLIVEKDCEKIHYIAPNIYCCGAGTAADTQYATAQISSQLELLRLESGRESRVKASLTMLSRHLFQHQGHISAALVLGGVDHEGPHLHTVYPHGSTDKLPYVSMGSGSVAAMSVLESGFKDGLTEAECVELVCRAIRSGVENDLGSGNSVNYCIITKDGVVNKKGTDREDDLHPISRGTVDKLDVNIYKQRVKLPNVFANFPPGYTKVIGEPKIERF